ncbi:MAG TPA: hypothetical protein VMX54_08580 [Vicinamibacteria bacterium]|nr:hypothetical protein [Vicinamibacteria bacterium]
MRPARTSLHVALALAVGLAFRLWVVAAYPYEAGDTPLYENLAKSLAAHHAFALEYEGRLLPVNVRMPGYPSLLAACHVLFGPGFQPVRVVQAVTDTATCPIAAAIAAMLASAAWRRRVFLAGLWLAVLCPFTANYAAAILAETPGAFWNTAATALLLLGVQRGDGRSFRDPGALAVLAAAGAAAGIGCYFRPETPLVLTAGGLVLLGLWWRPRDWGRLARVGLALGVGLVAALGPWALRNALVLHRAELLPPPAANLPGEMAPLGFNQWTQTWLTTNREIYLFSFRVEDEPLEIDKLPRIAYDSPQERERVARLFEEHNRDFTLTPRMDAAFAELARERTARHPLRTFLWVPLARVAALWISPRLELLPYSGVLTPVRQAWADDPYDFAATVLLFSANLLYIVLALLALPRVRWRTGGAIVVAYLLLRTALMTLMPGPEPRYVVIAFPLLAALAAQLWAGRDAAAVQAA